MMEVNEQMGELSAVMDRGKMVRQARRKVDREIRNAVGYLERVIGAYQSTLKS
jgi:hypothetical protein